MGYPWYSTGRRIGAHNQVTAVTIIENCNTQERRFKLDILVNHKIRSMTVRTTAEFTAAIAKLLDLAKAEDRIRELVFSDIAEISGKLA